MWKASDQLHTFDELVRGCLQAICNIKMDPNVWAQATLPTSQGGLGVRCSVDLVIPAFLALSFNLQLQI